MNERPVGVCVKLEAENVIKILIMSRMDDWINWRDFAISYCNSPADRSKSHSCYQCALRERHVNIVLDDFIDFNLNLEGRRRSKSFVRVFSLVCSDGPEKKITFRKQMTENRLQKKV